MKAILGFFDWMGGVLRISLITASDEISASVNSLEGDGNKGFWKNVVPQLLEAKRKQAAEELLGV